MKILHIASGDLMAGAEMQLLTLAKALHNIPGIAVDIVLLNHGTLETKLREIGIEVTVLDEKKLNALQILRLLIRTIRAQAPNVIHTHRLKENILGSMAALFAGRVPSLRTAHGAQEQPPTRWQLQKRTILALDRLAGCLLQRRIIAVSDNLAGILEKDFPAGKIHVIENGIDLDAILSQFPGQDPDPGRQHGRFRIGLAGRLVPVKRVDLLVETARYLRDHYPDLQASFHIYGDGPNRDALEQFSQMQKTSDIIQFEGHHENILNELQELDLILMTSDHEGLPMILLEAMALQLPIIAHAVGGIPKLLDHGSCGILVQNHSAEGYAREIYRLYTSRQLRSHIAGKALQRVSTYYSAGQNAGAYLSEYAKICR